MTCQVQSKHSVIIPVVVHDETKDPKLLNYYFECFLNLVFFVEVQTVKTVRMYCIVLNVWPALLLIISVLTCQ